VLVIIDLNNLKPVNDVFGLQNKLIRRTTEVLIAGTGDVIPPAWARWASSCRERNWMKRKMMERIGSLVVMNNKYRDLNYLSSAHPSTPGLSLSKVINNKTMRCTRIRGNAAAASFFGRIE
jgi:hypothetical protein